MKIGQSSVFLGLATTVCLIVPLIVLGAGGGGGGGGSETPPPPSCSADTWACSDWGICSTEGKQTRACSLSFNCPTTETAKPTETQNCQSPAPKEVVPAPNPAPAVQPIVISSPATKETKTSDPKTSVCTESELTCADWSQCKENGKQTRTCKVAKVCATAPKPKLSQDQVCPGLKCGQLETIKERVSCRLKLTPDEMKKEFSILYFPEYCKVEGEWADKKECLKLYQSFGTCWQMPLGEGRQQCVRDVIGLGSWIDEKKECLTKSNSLARYNCTNELKEKVEHFILFNLYELEVEAEAALTSGKATLETVTNFDVLIEEKKKQLEKSESIQDWKRIIGEAKIEWKKFKANLL